MTGQGDHLSLTEDLYAAYLRCSEEELQNPELSLDRQLRNCTIAVEKWGGRIVAVYYDIESAAVRYNQRGIANTAAKFNIPIARAGSLRDLMHAATTRPRAFNRVICENINRLARNSAVAFTLEDELRAAGVRLHCADEPFEESFGSIVLRHLNVGLARGYHHDLMKKSREGFESGIRQGWHMGGVVCYGYKFVEHPHPNPNKARQGLVRRTLELDMVRAPVIRRIFDEYLYGTRGLTEIRDLLNADPERYPTPVAVAPSQSLGVSSRTTIWEMLRQPKYTGFQVWNRRARKTGRGRWNPPEQWVWSEEPSHPAIVTREEFDRVQVKAAANIRSRRSDTTKADGTPRPATKTTQYLFRGRLVCALCGLRMWGTRPAHPYYRCVISHQRGAKIPQGHPRTINLGEGILTEAVTEFLATAMYGRDRHAYWERALTAAGLPDPAAPTQSRITELEQELTDLETRLNRQVLALEEDEVIPAARKRISERIQTLEDQLTATRQSLGKLRAQQPAAPPDLATAIPLLEALPLRGDQLRSLEPVELRAVIDNLDLKVVYDHPRHSAQIGVVLASTGSGVRGSDLCPR